MQVQDRNANQRKEKQRKRVQHPKTSHPTCMLGYLKFVCVLFQLITPHRLHGKDAYLAYATLRVSRITVIFTCPG